MADIAVASTSTIQGTSNLSDEQELNEIREIVWGPNIRLDVFQRWSQGLFVSITHHCSNNDNIVSNLTNCFRKQMKMHCLHKIKV